MAVVAQNESDSPETDAVGKNPATIQTKTQVSEASRAYASRAYTSRAYTSVPLCGNTNFLVPIVVTSVKFHSFEH